MTLFDLPISVSWPAFVTLAVLLIAWLKFLKDFKLAPGNIIVLVAFTGAFFKILLDLTLWGNNPGVIILHVTRYWVGAGFAALLLIIAILLSVRVRVTRTQGTDQADN